jgi:hypothetical protein
MTRRLAPAIATGCILIGACQGCATLSNGRGWGQDATLTPGWKRVESAAAGAVLDPETWAPLLGALLLQLDDADSRIADWAADETPVFGSNEKAAQWSDDLLRASEAAYWVSTLATPSGEEPLDWVIAKAKGVVVGLAATNITTETTNALKRTTQRRRPDDSSSGSFPSGHTSSASAHSTLARRNVEVLQIGRGGRVALDLGLAALAVGTAYCRVEARKHYPSDVLVGYSLGRLISSFVNDAFLGVEYEDAVSLDLGADERGLVVGIQVRF